MNKRLCPECGHDRGGLRPLKVIMSQNACDAFDDVRREILENSRDCGWCGKSLTSADILVLHIWDCHSKKSVPDSTYRALLKRINQPE